jgi:hypothetical protein
MASTGRIPPQVEPWESFRPQRPILYPTAPQFRDLSEEDATALMNFYDSVQGVAEIVSAWIETKGANGLVGATESTPRAKFSPTLPDRWS